MAAFTEEQVRAWLLEYAWSGTPEEQAAEVECILAQDDWKHLSARTEQLMAQASGDADHRQAFGSQELIDDATGMALSSLYECHDGPHLGTCPEARSLAERYGEASPETLSASQAPLEVDGPTPNEES